MTTPNGAWPPGEAAPQFPAGFPAAPAPVADLVDIAQEGPAAVRPGQPAPEPPTATGLPLNYDPTWGQPPQAGNVADPATGQPAEAPRDEQSIIMPTGDLITLTSGMKVRVKPLRTRELLALVNIGVSGIGPRLGDLALDPDGPTDVFVARFAGLVLTGLGSAGEEACAFLRMVVEPAGKVVTFRPDKAQRLRNAALEEALDEALGVVDYNGHRLVNPDPDDTISIIEKVVEMNAGDLQAWGKRLAGIWRLAQRTGQIPASPSSPGYPSSAG